MATVCSERAGVSLEESEAGTSGRLASCGADYLTCGTIHSPFGKLVGVTVAACPFRLSCHHARSRCWASDAGRKKQFTADSRYLGGRGTTTVAARYWPASILTR